MRPSVETDSLTIPTHEALSDALTVHTCLKNCYGERDMAGSCCTLTDRNYIIGPIRDAPALLARVSEKYGRDVPWDEIFIGFEEGSALFPDRPIWQREKSFPALRPNMSDATLPCHFLGEDNLCTIHDIRSTTCSKYFCGHLQTILDAL